MPYTIETNGHDKSTPTRKSLFHRDYRIAKLLLNKIELISRNGEKIRRTPEKIKIGYVGVGCYLPENVLTNAHLENMVDTSDEWIVQRTGIKTRRIMSSGETVSSMAVNAARAAIENAGIELEQISCIRIGVNTHMRFPSLASIVQEALNIQDTSASDVSAGCSSFIFSVEEIYNRLFVEYNLYGEKSYGLAIGVDGMSLISDYSDRNTCVLFGDGAGATIIGPVESGEILSTFTRTQGKYGNLLRLDPYLSVPLKDPVTMELEHFDKIDYPFLHMEGPKVFAVAVKTMVADARTVIKKYNQINGATITEKDIDYVYPHQANLRIVSAVADALKLPVDKVHSDGVRKYGNTSAASIPIAYVENIGKRPGCLELDISFGAGFASGAILRRVAD